MIPEGVTLSEVNTDIVTTTNNLSLSSLKIFFNLMLECRSEYIRRVYLGLSLYCLQKEEQAAKTTLSQQPLVLGTVQQRLHLSFFSLASDLQPFIILANNCSFIVYRTLKMALTLNHSSTEEKTSVATSKKTFFGKGTTCGMFNTNISLIPSLTLLPPPSALAVTIESVRQSLYAALLAAHVCAHDVADIDTRAANFKNDEAINYFCNKNSSQSNIILEYKTSLPKTKLEEIDFCLDSLHGRLLTAAGMIKSSQESIRNNIAEHGRTMASNVSAVPLAISPVVTEVQIAGDALKLNERNNINYPEQQLIFEAYTGEDKPESKTEMTPQERRNVAKIQRAILVAQERAITEEQVNLQQLMQELRSVIRRPD